jgi:hypothetical protein
MKSLNNSNVAISVALLGFAILNLICINNGYFWDNIQQISKEAHWFYQTNFSSLLMPSQNSGAEIIATGYHPPLMGIMTAALWKLFGYSIWVSHIFIYFWAVLLVVNLWKLVQFLFPEKYQVWIFFIVLLEPTVLSQFAIASPDFILFTAFIICLRALFKKEPLLLAIGFFFLCCINMRGIFVGSILIIINYYSYYLENKNQLTFRAIGEIIPPFLPTLIILATYFTYYIVVQGWFFSQSSEDGHYSAPNSVHRVIIHLAEFGLRSIENGRILIWILAAILIGIYLKYKTQLPLLTKVLVVYYSLLLGLYLLFVVITQMPFSARYFLPQFFLLTLLTTQGLIKHFKERRIKVLFILIICFELTGHFWIYPDKIAKSWDCTLAHLPYYQLREKCFDYIDAQKLDYKDISAGFCLYENRRFVELKNNDKTVRCDTSCKYFIFSNISNVEDVFAASLKDGRNWTAVKHFESGVVYITILKRK